MESQEYIDAARRPVDPELFLRCMRVFAENFDRPVPDDLEQVLSEKSAADGVPRPATILERGTFWVVTWLRQLGLEAFFSPAAINRLWHFGEIFTPENLAFFGPELLRYEDGPEGFQACWVEDSLAKAAAQARIVLRDDGIEVFDLEDLREHANRFLAGGQGG